jgi:hypothetical protein
MEVFFASTPTYSGNYKASLEGFPVQSQRHASAPDRAGLALKRDAQLLPYLNIGGGK